MTEHPTHWLGKASVFVTEWWPPRPIRVALHMGYQYWHGSDLFAHRVFHLLIAFFLVDLVWTYTARLAWYALTTLTHYWLLCNAYVVLWFCWLREVDWPRTLWRWRYGHWDVVLRRDDWEQYRERSRCNNRLDQPTGSPQYLLTAHEYWPGHAFFTGPASASGVCAHCGDWWNGNQPICHLAGLSFNASCIAPALDEFLYARYKLMSLGGLTYDLRCLLTLAIQRLCLNPARNHHNTLAQVRDARERKLSERLKKESEQRTETILGRFIRTGHIRTPF